MTVREMIDILEDFDEDMDVVIGMQQRYGSDFAMNVVCIDETDVNDWDGELATKCVITQGKQIGTVHYDD